MRITTVFFKRSINKTTKNIVYWFRNILYLTYISILVTALTFFISHINISSNIIGFAGNIRISEENSLTLASFKNIYPVFNNSSYIIRERVNNEVITVANRNQSELEIIDKFVVDEAVSVFSNKRKLSIVTNDTPDIERTTIDNMKILNYSSLRNINYQELYDKIITLTKTSDKILLYNTHTSEAYANCDKYQFSYTGTYRTTDPKYNMIAVAKELDKNLKEKNISVVQDTTPHDYGTYTSSYARSKKTIEANINRNGSFGISIDLHRDAGRELTFAPKVNINGVDVAQLMFVVGVGSSKNRNPFHLDNLSLALQIQLLADKVYPGLFRPMLIRDSVYNQDLNKHSLLIEVGATGNTIDEAYYATRCLSNLLDIIYKK